RLPCLRDELLVRGADVLAALERPELRITPRVGPADDLDHDRDIRVVEDRVRVGRDRDVAGVADLLRIAHRRRDETQRASGCCVDAPRAIRERTRHGGADGPQAEKADTERPRAHWGRPHTTSATSSARTWVTAWRAKMARASRSKSSARAPRVVRESELVLASMAM